MADVERTLVETFLKARREGRPAETAALTPPPDAATAYRIQAAVASESGPVGGFKAGRGGPALTMAPIRAATVRESGAAIPAAESRLRGVELELAFRLTAPPPPVDVPDFEDRLAAGVVLLPALEIVESRMTVFETADPLLKLADNVGNGGVVLGAPVADWRGLDLSRPNVRLAFAGETMREGPSAPPGGDAFATLVELARLAKDFCGGLQEGHVVITGSLTGLLYAKEGDRIRGEIAGVGVVEAQFA